MAVSKGSEQSVSVLRLMVSLLLAGVICGAVVGFAYLSLLLFASLEGIGIPGTAFLAAILLITTEQAMVFLVSRWRPPVLSLVLSALPATAVAFVLRGLFHWHGWLGIVFAVAAGLAIQAVVLHRLTVAVVRKASGSVARLGAESGTESAAGRQPGTPSGEV